MRDLGIDEYHELLLLACPDFQRRFTVLAARHHSDHRLSRATFLHALSGILRNGGVQATATSL